jgi:exodeoxyribonuclease X
MTRVWVLDSETTGVDPEMDKVVEVAGVLLEDGKPVGQFQSLVDPGVPIPPQASAVHHLRDTDVAGQPSLDDAMKPVRDNPADYYVAHNANFDRAFLKVEDKPWICTWKCSLRAFVDAPSYSNQVLRYWLGLPDPVCGGHAHRALYDAEVTSHLLVRLVTASTRESPYESMAEISSKPGLMRRISFGVHKDKLYSEVPVDYLNWILNKSSGWSEDQLYSARYWLEKRRAG